MAGPQDPTGDLVAGLRRGHAAYLATHRLYARLARRLTDDAPRAADRFSRVVREQLLQRKRAARALAKLGERPGGRPAAWLAFYGGLLALFVPLLPTGLLLAYAARAERRRRIRYARAARVSIAIGRPDITETLLAISETAWDHADHLRRRAVRTPWTRFVPHGPDPVPRESLRAELDAHLDVARWSRSSPRGDVPGPGGFSHALGGPKDPR